MFQKLSQIDKNIEENKKNIEILPTGFGNLDHFLDGGFLKKELVVLGGKTGGGKSIFGGSLFYNIASAGYKSAYFSLEISNEMIVSRLVGAQANLSPTRVMITELSDYDQKLKDEAKAKVAVYEEFMHFYDDVYELGKIVKEIHENQFDFVVIDFIQNVMMGNRDEYERLSSVALALQQIAKKSNTCILALSQLSNQMVRDSRKKELVEYKGSGSIGTVADLGFFIEDGNEYADFVLRLRKNRRGISGQEFNFQLQKPGGRLIPLTR
jgi:replicative DNA helicase